MWRCTRTASVSSPAGFTRKRWNMILLSQAQSDRAILAKQLGISEHQLSYITHSNSGEGLLFYGSVTIPFVDRFPKGEIYNLLTTRPEDMAHERKDE